MPKVKAFFTPKRLTTMAIFIALQIVLARFAGIQVSEGLRISFEAIPVILAGIWLGPMAGLVVGFLSDFIGTVISGYGVYFLPLAITPILNGVLPGLCYRYIFKGNMGIVKCVALVIVTEIISGLLLGTYALTWYFHLFVPNRQATFAILFVPRLAKLVTMACDAVLVWLLHKTAYKRAIAPVLLGHA
jgi:ECF transporter S component (folate family)